MPLICDNANYLKLQSKQKCKFNYLLCRGGMKCSFFSRFRFHRDDLVLCIVFKWIMLFKKSSYLGSKIKLLLSIQNKEFIIWRIFYFLFFIFLPTHPANKNFDKKYSRQILCKQLTQFDWKYIKCTINIRGHFKFSEDNSRKFLIFLKLFPSDGLNLIGHKKKKRRKLGSMSEKSEWANERMR